jgi:hypothetical protein
MTKPKKDKPIQKLKQILRSRWTWGGVTLFIVFLVVARRLWLPFDILATALNVGSWIRQNLLLDLTTLLLLIIALLPWLILGARRIDGTTRLKIAISVLAVLLLIAHLTRQDLVIDAITIGLIALAALPWLIFMIESVELPGVVKITLRDFSTAQKAFGVAAPPQQINLSSQSYSMIASPNPNLALVGLRIEIESRIRALAQESAISDQKKSLIGMIYELRGANIFDEETTTGLAELVQAANRAAHGETVDPQVAWWVVDYGPAVLAVLDEKLQAAGKPSIVLMSESEVAPKE